jgi:hypothetical protein
VSRLSKLQEPDSEAGGDQMFGRQGFHIRLSCAGLRMKSDECAGEAYLIFKLNHNKSIWIAIYILLQSMCQDMYKHTKGSEAETDR